MEVVLFLVVAAVLIGGYHLIANLIGSATETAFDAALTPVAKMMDKAEYKRVSKELAVPHQFRLRAPVEQVQRTLDNLPGLPEHPPQNFAPYYLRKEQGRVKFGIANQRLANHYDIEVQYRPESFGTSGELRFLRWPDDAADDRESHRDIIETVLNELRRLDTGLQVRRPEVAA